MSFEEKSTWTFLVVVVAACGVYLGFLLPALAAGTPIERVDYAIPMLWTIGGTIVVGILARIVLVIVTPRDDQAADVRDREIDRAGERVGNSLVVLGGSVALVLALLEVDWFWIANELYLAFVLSGVLAGVAKLVMYRRGVPTW